jgi:hypothetical protein
MDIGDLIIKMRAVDFNKLFDESLEEVFPNIIELIKEQLSEGETAFGFITPNYVTESYPYFKQKYVATYKIYPDVDLRFEGNFYEGIFIKNGLLAIMIESKDSKSNKLEKKYGSEIFILNENNMEKLKPILYNIIMNKYRNAVGFN